MSQKTLPIKPGTLNLYIKKLLIFIVLALVLISVLAVVSLLAKSPLQPVMPSEDSLTWVSFNTDAIPVSESLSIVNRPLFWDSRTPYAPEEEQNVPVADTPRNRILDDAKLLGIFSVGQESSIVLRKDKDKFRVSLNEDFRGWTLINVSPDSVVFGETQTLNGEAPNLKTILLEEREPLPVQWQRSGSVSAESR